jgi:hypothetical protein
MEIDVFRREQQIGPNHFQKSVLIFSVFVRHKYEDGSSSKCQPNPQCLLEAPACQSAVRSITRFSVTCQHDNAEIFRPKCT